MPYGQTLKDRATQLLKKYKSGALVTQYENIGAVSCLQFILFAFFGRERPFWGTSGSIPIFRFRVPIWGFQVAEDQPLLWNQTNFMKTKTKWERSLLSLVRSRFLLGALWFWEPYFCRNLAWSYKKGWSLSTGTRKEGNDLWFQKGRFSATKHDKIWQNKLVNICVDNIYEQNWSLQFVALFRVKKTRLYGVATAN